MLEIMPNALLKKGEVVFKEGEVPDGVYYICSGSVKVTKGPSDAPVLLAELETGDIFGELAMIDLRSRAATVTAIEDTWVYKFSANAFQKKLEAMDPIMRSIVVTLVLTVRNMNLKQEKLLARWGYPKPDDSAV